MLFPAATFAAYIKIGTTKCPISRQKPSKQCLERSDEWSQPLPLRNRLGAMNNMLPLIVCSVFLVLGLWHFYMAAMPVSGETGAVPSVEGRPLFVPSARATVAVGVVLVLFAALVAGTAGVLPLGLPMFALQYLFGEGIPDWVMILYCTVGATLLTLPSVLVLMWLNGFEIGWTREDGDELP